MALLFGVNCPMQLNQALACGESGSHKTKSAEMPSVGTLRGLQWRLHLDVLPSNSSTIDQLRQAAADGRRRYAELRRRLLVDPHAMEEPHRSLADIDNPLSQNPDSVWSRYFQNAEIERTIDTDLTRLYPEHESFFQNPSCQAMLRRILLVWSLTHPQYSYRQGMHELLAPLLYVLHIDVMHLSQIKQQNEDLFDDRFEGPLLLEPNILGNRKQQASQHLTFCNTHTTPNNKCSEEWQEIRAPRNKPQLKVDETGFDFKIMVLGSDTYGAEGELGALLSARFVEHDAYVMFDALMTGKGGGVKMADYFLPTNGSTSITGLSPVLEASYSIYRVLAAADLSLYNHLMELGVEPQFFAMRWLRVLFGREFDLDKILLLWDAIFLVEDKNESWTIKEDSGSFQHSSRRDFILAVAVSMLLYLRQTLLAALSATDCLKKLLNFPQNADVEILIESAKLLTPLVENTARIVPSGQPMATYENGKSRKSPQSGDNVQTVPTRNKFLRTPSFSPEILKKPLPDSYWEEKWKKSVLQKALPWIDEETLSTPGNTHKITAKCFSLTEAHLNSKGGLSDLMDRPSSQTTLPDVLNKGNVERFYTDSMKGPVLAHLHPLSKLTPGFKRSSRPWLPSGDGLEDGGKSSYRDLTSVSTSNGNLCHTSASPKSTTQDPVSQQLSAGDRSFDTNAGQSSLNSPLIESGSTALPSIPNLQESSNIAASNDSPVTSQSRKNWVWKLGSGSREKTGLFSASKTDREATNGSATSEGPETLSKLEKESLHSQDSTLPSSKEQKDVSFRDELLDLRFSMNPSHAESAIEGQSLKFGALAQCISDNIQVIEDAFTMMDSCESKSLIKDSEVSTLSQKDNLECLSGETRFEDVQAALLELRKISTALSQM